jgi:predicted nucleic acid-binding protein
VLRVARGHDVRRCQRLHIIYAVGRQHPLKPEARAFFEDALGNPAARLCSSAEVLQELLHAYLPVQRIATLDAAWRLAASVLNELWAVEPEDMRLARDLIESFPGIGARDLLHLSCCRRRGVMEIKTFDRALAAAFAA